MGQNNFSLMGPLFVADGEKPEIIKLNGYEVPAMKAVIESGPAWADVRHNIMLTGEAANLVYEWLQHRSKITVLVQGSLKTYGERMWPVAVYARVYEKSGTTGDLASGMLKPDKLAKLIQENMSHEQIMLLLSELKSPLRPY